MNNFHPIDLLSTRNIAFMSLFFLEDLRISMKRETHCLYDKGVPESINFLSGA
jgi:hypothetical protein